MTHPIDNEVTPWYRQFWPWLIVGILSWGVVSSAITLTVAVSNPPQMMAGDYQRLGKLLVDTHRRADRAEALGVSGALIVSAGRWWLDLRGNDPDSLPASVLMSYQHPTDAALDRQIMFQRGPDSRYSATFAELPPRGRVIVSDLEQSWWISASLAPEASTIELRPERL